MKKTTRFLALSLMLALCLCLAACGSSQGSAAADTDSAYVKANGKLIVGITDFAPMDFQDASGNWVGFDADMAAAFAESLGVAVEYQVIE